jgi:hypothetical protein
VSYVLSGRKVWKNMDNFILVKKQEGKKITPDEVNALVRMQRGLGPGRF